MLWNAPAAGSVSRRRISTPVEGQGRSGVPGGHMGAVLGPRVGHRRSWIWIYPRATLARSRDCERHRRPPGQGAAILHEGFPPLAFCSRWQVPIPDAARGASAWRDEVPPPTPSTTTPPPEYRDATVDAPPARKPGGGEEHHHRPHLPPSRRLAEDRCRQNKLNSSANEFSTPSSPLGCWREDQECGEPHVSAASAVLQ
ncbi:unnamed protein product [Urochloa humidicola]